MGATMAIDFSQLNYWHNPTVEQITSDPTTLLNSLTAPTVIDITGEDNRRCRVIVTLIHGNEPSGFIAIHRWLSLYSQDKRLLPKTSLRFILASVEAAQLEPQLSHRYLPDGKDLNRCFNNPSTHDYYLRAQKISDAITAVSPEAVLDLHNTSGFSPAFAVATVENSAVLSLASLFCQSMIVSKISLGALMELNTQCPIITIECGGREDQQSHEIAYQGILQLGANSDISQCHHLTLVDIIEQPLRLQINAESPLSYANQQPEKIEGLVLKSYIEQFNFGDTCSGRTLGWVDGNGLDNLSLIDANGNNCIANYFCIEQNKLKSKVNMRLFMATGNLSIARNDCLCYIVARVNKTNEN